MKNKLLGECFAEFIGTFILLFIGIGVVASLVAVNANVTFWGLSMCWGLAITIAIFVVGDTSGAHINPAVTIALAVWKKFDKKKVIPYIVSQVLGAFTAAAIVYALYGSSIRQFESSKNIIRNSQSGWSSAGIFSTFPKTGLSMPNAFMVEMCITAILVLVIFAVTDGYNRSCPKNGMPALAIGLVVALLGASFGPLTGFAMNPARDFGPRLLCVLAGWGTSAFGPNNYGLIVPIFAPIVGGILGGGIYEKLISLYLPAKMKPSIEKNQVES
ncbi:MIP/aquaporin family protein [Clostridium ljungdahlii]|nr:MIP/aquaporin family protein [Clostridium ljungdahlii]